MKAMRRVVAAVLLSTLVVAPRAVASTTTAVTLRAGDVVDLVVGPAGSSPPQPVLPVMASIPGDVVAFTLRDSRGAVVGGSAFLSLPGNDVAGQLSLPVQSKGRLTQGRYRLAVSGHGSTALRLTTAATMKVVGRTRNARALTASRFATSAQSVDVWSGEPLPDDTGAFLILFGGAVGNTSGFVAGLCARDSTPARCQDPALLGSNTDHVTGDQGAKNWVTSYQVFRPSTVRSGSSYEGHIVVALPTDSTFHGWALVR